MLTLWMVEQLVTRHALPWQSEGTFIQTIFVTKLLVSNMILNSFIGVNQLIGKLDWRFKNKERRLVIKGVDGCNYITSIPIYYTISHSVPPPHSTLYTTPISQTIVPSTSCTTTPLSRRSSMLAYNPAMYIFNELDSVNSQFDHSPHLHLLI